MKFRTIGLMLAIVASSGCTINKEWVATDGSKAHGTVTLAFEYPLGHSPETKMYQAESLARKKCQDWGYQNAKVFGGGEKICAERGITGLCETYRVTMKMQCTGGFSYAY